MSVLFLLLSKVLPVELGMIGQLLAFHTFAQARWWVNISRLVIWVLLVNV